MQLLHNVSLKNYSTMRLGDTATAVVEIYSKVDLQEAADYAKKNNLPILTLGGGSNIIFSNGFDGLVIVNRIPGFKILEDNSTATTIELGAGENWDSAVKRTVEMNLSGIEALSFIPGTVGGTPVQNVGAYGSEIADTLVELEAYDLSQDLFVKLSKEECHFSYRNSIFKPPHPRRYIITSVTLKLCRSLPTPPFYASLQTYLDEYNITTYTPQTIRNAVIAIRSEKLPDPSIIANTGSFFKNPIVSTEDFKTLQINYPMVASYALADGRVKIAAGWLIDMAGLKGYKAHGMRIYEKNALVFVNDSAQSFADLQAFKQEVVSKVNNKFGITLQQEPELI